MLIGAFGPHRFFLISLFLLERLMTGAARPQSDVGSPSYLPLRPPPPSLFHPIAVIVYTTIYHDVRTSRIYQWGIYLKNTNTLQLWDRGFCRFLCSRAVCVTPIARITGCVLSLTLLAPHSRYGDKTLGVKSRKKKWGWKWVKDLGRRLPLELLNTAV